MRQNKSSARIPVSVIIVTKNEEKAIVQCLENLSHFNEVIVVDSQSEDRTVAIARKIGVRVYDFIWNGQYPKKRQWCLEHLDLQHDWVFFVDADEIVTDEVVQDISQLFKHGDPVEAGFFIGADYLWKGQLLSHGLKNNKLVLLDRRRIEFPVIDDLDLEGMGEIEGHYQPVLKPAFSGDGIGQLKGKILHHIDESKNWEKRHQRYAKWEAGMNAKDAWPLDPLPWRAFLKRVFRAIPMRHIAAFLHCYLLKLGFLDGFNGFDFALSRARYYRMISSVSASKKDEARIF